MSSVQFCLEISQALRKKIPEIVAEWLVHVRHSIEAAQNESKPIIIDHLPDVLNTLADAFELEALADKKIKKHHIMSKEHGKQRGMETEFSLTDLLKEYSILREVILKKLFPTEFVVLESAITLHRFLDEAVQESVTEYVNYHQSLLQKNLEDLNKEKEIRDRFVAALSHDLRTPLAAAKMSAQFILRKPESGEISLKHIPKIVSSIDRIDHMIQDLLDATLIKSGRHVPLEIQECHLNKIIEETIIDLTSIHGPRFEFSLNEEIYGQWSNSALRRILENLCNNAVKYGSETEMIRVLAVKDGDELTLTVHNHGEPIAEKELEALFIQFHRTDNAKSSGKKGWGIGLMLVKGLVEAQGGSIDVKTGSGEGTSFIITLPIDSRSFVNEKI